MNLRFSPSARSGLCPTGRDARPINAEFLLQAPLNQSYKHFKTSKTFRFKLFSRKAKQKVQRLVVALEAPWRLTLPKDTSLQAFHIFSCSLTPALGALSNPLRCVQLCRSSLRQLPENPEFKLVHVRAKKTIPRPSSKTSPRQAPGLGPGACQSIAFHCIPLEDHAEYGTQLSWPQWQCFSGLQSIESPFFCWKANAKANASSAPKVEELALANIFKLIRAAGECWSDGME